MEHTLNVLGMVPINDRESMCIPGNEIQLAVGAPLYRESKIAGTGIDRLREEAAAYWHECSLTVSEL